MMLMASSKPSQSKSSSPQSCIIYLLLLLNFPNKMCQLHQPINNHIQSSFLWLKKIIALDETPSIS
jgi:hypothetical protein